MGLVARLKVIPADAFKRLKKDPDALLAAEIGPEFSLDKAWLELHTVFRQESKTLAQCISGDVPGSGPFEGDFIRPPRSADMDDDEDFPDQADFYLGFMSPGFVKRVDKQLATLKIEKVVEVLKGDGWEVTKADQKYYSFALAALKKAYRTAAQKGNALNILIT